MGDDAARLLEGSTAHHEAAHAVVLYRTAGHVGGPVSILRGEGILGSAHDGVSDSFNEQHSEATILSCYAGGHAQRMVDVRHGTDGCQGDEDIADDWLRRLGWESREQELRDRSRSLTEQHWKEIVAVAEELLRARLLDDAEVEIIADAAAGDPDADLERYRLLGGESLSAWRREAVERASNGEESGGA